VLKKLKTRASSRSRLVDCYSGATRQEGMTIARDNDVPLRRWRVERGARLQRLRRRRANRRSSPWIATWTARAIRPEWFYTETIREELHQRASINWCIREVYPDRSHRGRDVWRRKLRPQLPPSPPRDPSLGAISRHSPAPRWPLSGSSIRIRILRSRRRRPCRPLAPRRHRRRSPGRARSLPSCSLRCRPAGRRETSISPAVH